MNDTGIRLAVWALFAYVLLALGLYVAWVVERYVENVHYAQRVEERRYRSR